MSNLKSMGFHTPTVIEMQAIPIMMHVCMSLLLQLVVVVAVVVVVVVVVAVTATTTTPAAAAAAASSWSPKFSSRLALDAHVIFIK